MRTEDLASVKN